MTTVPTFSPPASATTYLDADDVIGFHAHLFGLEPEQGAARVRSRDVLEGALARPRQHAHYDGADLATQAAMLAHGIAQGQPFIDGNKRTALVAMSAFLAANDRRLDASQPKIAGRIYGLSQDVTADLLANWIRECLTDASTG